MMKKLAGILLTLLAAVLLSSCCKSFQDIRLTSCDLVELSPRGLSSIDATIEVGVDNPTVQVTLTGMDATLKMDGSPCLHLTADDVTLEPRTEKVYSILIHGAIDGNFNPLQLLLLLNQPNFLEPMTADVRFRGVLKSGLGKDFEYTDIPLKDLLDKL
ncbi:MAG: hypothetical protein J5695_01915 [Bacteroidales bacterium]|nr:hypothetical protein [Bacteroidales bacterium]